MQLWLNNWSAALTAEASAVAGQLSIDPAAAALLVGLGTGDHYLLTLVDIDESGQEVAWEIVTVTAQSAGVLDVLRGQEGTSARIWAIGTPISARVTRGTLEQLRDNAGAALSDAAPQALGAAAPGTAEESSRADHVHPLPTPAAIGAATAAQGATADSAVQPGDLAAVATSGNYSDLAGAPAIPALSDAAPQAPGAAAAGTSPAASRADHVHPLPTPAAIGAATADQGELADTAVQPAALTAALDAKVDKVTGYGLSQENFTPAEKTKLAGLQDQLFLGTYINLAALQSAHPTATPGAYADVDAGAADPVLRYIWDDSDSEWVAQAGSADPITAAQVKTLYESNPDTNAYTDAEKSKLAGVAAGATANSNTDSLAEGASNLYHTAARVRAVVLTGLSLVDDTVVAATDTVLQAIGKLAARLALAFDRANHTGTQAISTVTGLQTALDARGLVAGLPSRTVTGSGAVTPADAGYWIICDSASPMTLTIGAEATASWAVSGVLPMFHVLQIGAGAVTVTGDGFSVTLHGSDTNVLDGAGSAATALRRASDTWNLFGRLVAA